MTACGSVRSGAGGNPGLPLLVMAVEQHAVPFRALGTDRRRARSHWLEQKPARIRAMLSPVVRGARRTAPALGAWFGSKAGARGEGSRVEAIGRSGWSGRPSGSKMGCRDVGPLLAEVVGDESSVAVLRCCLAAQKCGGLLERALGEDVLYCAGFH